MTGNVIGQLIAILAIPIITRIYSVEAYGVYAVLLALVVIMSAVSSMGLHLAILIPKSDVEAKALARLAITIHILFCMAVVFALMAFHQNITGLLGLSSAGNLLFAVPILVFLQGLYLILTYCCVREQMFGRLGIAKIVEAVLDRGSAIGATVLLPASSLLLVAARALSNLATILYLLPCLIKERSTEHERVVRSKALVSRYRGYLLFNTPSVLLANATVQLPTIIIGSMYTAHAAGLYALAYRLVSVPVTAVGGALSKLYTLRIAQAYTNGNMRSVTSDTNALFVALFSLFLVPFCLLFVIGEDLFSIILGPDWSQAGVYAQYLSIFVMTNLLVQTFGGLFDILGKQKIRFIFHVFSFLARIGTVLGMAFFQFDLEELVKGYSFVAIVMNVLALHLLFSLIRMPTLIPQTMAKSGLQVLVYFGFILFVLPLCSIDTPLLRIAVVSLFCGVWFVLVVIDNEELRSRVLKASSKEQTKPT